MNRKNETSFILRIHFKFPTLTMALTSSPLRLSLAYRHLVFFLPDVSWWWWGILPHTDISSEFQSRNSKANVSLKQTTKTSFFSQTCLARDLCYGEESCRNIHCFLFKYLCVHGFGVSSRIIFRYTFLCISTSQPKNLSEKR